MTPGSQMWKSGTSEGSTYLNTLFGWAAHPFVRIVFYLREKYSGLDFAVTAYSAALSPASNPEVLWCLNRKTSAFQQVDIQIEATSPIDYVPKVAAAWSVDGSLAFAIGSASTRTSQIAQT